MQIVMTVSLLSIAMSLVYLNSAWALNAIGQHPAFQNEDQPSRTLFQARHSGAQAVERFNGRETAIAKMNQLMFRETIQRLTAPNAFKQPQPIAEIPNPNRRLQ